MTNVVMLEEFLAANELADLWQLALVRSDDFVASRVIQGPHHDREDPRVRRSRVLFDVARPRELFARRIITFLPRVLRRVGLPPFEVSDVEAQLTASNDGEFFRSHTDNDEHCVGDRRLTFVYFFHREPRPFEGGELRIYDSEVPTVVEARVNQIVFFPSHLTHEVTPVSCPTRQFVDSRFTFNGWLHGTP